MNYKLLLLDVDGTLTASKDDAVPSPRVIKAVKQAQKRITVALATGRPKDLCQLILDALELHGYGIFNGGSEIINITTGRLEFEQLLSVEQWKKLIELALPFGYPVYTAEDQYSMPLSSASPITAPAVKVFIDAVANRDIPPMIDELSSVENVWAHPTTSWKDGDVMDIHIVHALASKRHGAEKLIELLGLRPEEVIAVGDGYNDVPLLEAAGLKVAMGNAPDEVKASADYIAPLLEKDGVAEVIERFILR